MFPALLLKRHGASAGEKNIILGNTIELSSIPTIKNLVKNDVGISYLPRFAVQKELNEKSLVEIYTELTTKTITAVCGHHKNKWISPLMKLFIDLCTNSYKRIENN